MAPLGEYRSASSLNLSFVAHLGVGEGLSPSLHLTYTDPFVKADLHPSQHLTYMALLAAFGLRRVDPDLRGPSL